MNYSRQLAVIDPNDLKDLRVDLIGAGAVGSYISWELAKIGTKNMHLWDADIVQDHNVCNQMFNLEHVNKPKVLAVAEMLKAGTGMMPSMHAQMVEGKTEFGDYVFLAVDSMKVRKDIWEHSIKKNRHISRMIEVRMGASDMRVYTINPNLPEDIVGWEDSLYSDDEAEVSLCGSSVSIAPTAMLTASLAVWQLIRSVKGDLNIESEVIMSTRAMGLYTNKFVPR
jgi:hypothetical protein